jgi:arylsulfatase A-like enzyme
MAGLGMGAATLAGPMALFAADAAQKGFNVLWINVDDLSCGLGCYGNKQVHSPHIDALAAKGVLFERAYVQQAVCAASRASYLTGCRPDTTTVTYPYNDFFTKEFLPAHPSLPRWFCMNGYYARAAGKIHHAGLLDLADNRLSGPYADTSGGKKGWQDYALPGNAEKKPPFECADVEDNAYSDGLLAEATIQYLRDAKAQNKPFFIAPGFRKPHLPFNAPKKYWDLYKREELQLAPNPNKPENVDATFTIATFELPSYEGGWGTAEKPVTEDMARTLRHGYYACTSYMDAQVGKILKALEDLELVEKTIVMFCSDHGFHLGDNGMWGKHVNYETANHSPLIVYVPGMKGNGKRCPALVEYVDMFPTLCEVTGAPKPDYLEGASLVPLLENPDREWKNAVFHQFHRGQMMGYAIRTRRHRYVEWRTIKGEKTGSVVLQELYDFETDPYEKKNIAPENPDLVKELAERLKAGWKAALPT